MRKHKLLWLLLIPFLFVLIFLLTRCSSPKEKRNTLIKNETGDQKDKAKSEKPEKDVPDNSSDREAKEHQDAVNEKQGRKGGKSEQSGNSQGESSSSSPQESSNSSTPKATDNSNSEETSNEESSSRNEESNGNGNTSEHSNPQPESSTPKEESSTAHTHSWEDITETVHHEAVTEMVPVYEEYEVIDEPEWDEAVGYDPYYQFSDGHIIWVHDYPDQYSLADAIADYATSGGGGYSVYDNPIYEHHEAVTHTEQTLVDYEEQVVQEAYDETVVVGRRCTSCGAEEYN